MKVRIDKIREYSALAYRVALSAILEIDWFDVLFKCFLIAVSLLLVLLAVAVARGDIKPNEPREARIRELITHGEVHEYVDFDRGIAHAPNCKFCKGEIK